MVAYIEKAHFGIDNGFFVMKMGRLRQEQVGYVENGQFASKKKKAENGSLCRK